MAEKDDLTMRIERLEIDNRRLKAQLRLANREIDRLENGICRIRDYMNSEYEHQNDNYLDVIANDIAEICEDTLSEVSNMPFDENEETGFIG